MPAHDPAPREGGSPWPPLRFVILGDFVGASESPPISQRSLIPANDLDIAMRALRPELVRAADADDGGIETRRFRFQNLGDFEGQLDASTPVDGASLLDLAIEKTQPDCPPGRHELSGEPDFEQLRSSWHGVKQLTVSCGDHVELKLLQATKAELSRDLHDAPSLEDTLLFRRLYADTCEAGVDPITLLIYDAELDTHPRDLELIRYIATIGSIAQLPILTNAGPQLVRADWSSFTELRSADQLRSLMDGPQHASWRSLRQVDETRYVSICMPPWRKVSGPPVWIRAAHAVATLIAQDANVGGDTLTAVLPDAELRSEPHPNAVRNLNAAGVTALAPSGSGVRAHAAQLIKGKPNAPVDPAALIQSCRLHQALLSVARDQQANPSAIREAVEKWLEGAADRVSWTGPIRVTDDGFLELQVGPAASAPDRPRVALPIPGL